MFEYTAIKLYLMLGLGFIWVREGMWPFIFEGKKESTVFAENVKEWTFQFPQNAVPV